jgi:hypothetical protein
VLAIMQGGHQRMYIYFVFQAMGPGNHHIQLYGVCATVVGISCKQASLRIFCPCVSLSFVCPNFKHADCSYYLATYTILCKHYLTSITMKTVHFVLSVYSQASSLVNPCIQLLQIYTLKLASSRLRHSCAIN